jgi:hypothetical protein
MIRFQSFHIKRERTAFPEPRQFEVGPNPSYFNSLCAGVFSPILHLPQILWWGCLWPFLNSLWRGVWFIGFSMLAGLLGRANGFVITQVEKNELTEEDKHKAINDMLAGTGYRAVPLNAPQDFGGSGQH